MGHYKVSIITICLNSERVIESTIQSVLAQSYKNIEYIIVDGESTDATLDIVKRYQSKISLLVSEQDSGVYNAMNKGLKLMTGEIVLFLNAGDYLYDADVIGDVVDVFKGKPDIKILYGNVMLDYRSKRKLRRYNKIDRPFLCCSMICHQVIFAKKEVFVKYGLFEEELRAVADKNWLLNLLFNHKKEVVAYFFDRIICVFDKTEGLSTKPFSYFDEHIKILKGYYSNLEIFFYYPICIIRQRIRKMFFEKRV